MKGVILIFIMVMILIIAMYSASGSINNSSKVLVTRPATEVILSPESLGYGWNGTVSGSDTEAWATFNNMGNNSFSIHIIKFDSNSAAGSYYENDIQGMGGSPVNIGEKAVLITMGPLSKLIEFHRGNMVAALLWNQGTSSFSEQQMEQFAGDQNDRFGPSSWI
jgi:hypothetical protein